MIVINFSCAKERNIKMNLKATKTENTIVFEEVSGIVVGQMELLSGKCQLKIGQRAIAMESDASISGVWNIAEEGNELRTCVFNKFSGNVYILPLNYHLTGIDNREEKICLTDNKNYVLVSIAAESTNSFNLQVADAVDVLWAFVTMYYQWAELPARTGVLAEHFD